jgi:hypothetical protein
MEKAITEVAAYALKHKVEINIDPSGKVSLWCTVDQSDFTIDNIKIFGIKKATDALVEFRKQGWKSN